MIAAQEQADLTDIEKSKEQALAGLDDRISGLADLMAQKLSVTGTFNPLAAAGLRAGDANERTARNTEQIAKHAKRLADAAATGGLKFA